MPETDLATTLNTAPVLRVRGADAAMFMQAQLTSNLDSLAVAAWQWSAWLDARGRVRFVAQLGRLAENDMLLVLRGGDAAVLGAALRRYVFRLRVEVSAAIAPTAAGDAAVANTLTSGGGGKVIFGMGKRSLVLNGTATANNEALREAFALADIRAGYPTLPATALERLLPPALGLYRLGAVAGDKGCYPGQEMTNRLRRGDHKWRLRRVERESHRHPGDEIVIDGREAGIVLAVAAGEALVVLRDDAVAAPGSPAVLETFPA